MSVSYNKRLFIEREKKGLSLKDAAKGIGISRFALFLYENGYFRPSKKALTKIKEFYEIKEDFKAEEEYPQSYEFTSKEKKPKKKRLLFFGIISTLALGIFFSGAGLFNESTNSDKHYFGEVYEEAKRVAFEKGKPGRDLITDSEYYYLADGDDPSNGMIIFYTKNSVLNFNTTIITHSIIDSEKPEYGLNHLQFQFGDKLSTDSYICKVTYKSSKAKILLTCDFEYKNEEVKTLNNLAIQKLGETDISEEFLLFLINFSITGDVYSFSKILSNSLGREVDFYNDFLFAREQGRKTIYRMQIWGLSLLSFSIPAFFIGIALLVFTLIKGSKKLEKVNTLNNDNKISKPLPKDLNINVGIPDYLIIWLSRIMAFGSLAMMLLSSLGGLFLSLPPLFKDQTFLDFLRICFIAAPFLRQLVIVRSIKNAKIVLKEFTKFSLLHIFIASFESILIYVTSMWGYDVASLLYSYIPSTIFYVTALNYLIAIFLFVTPSFIKSKKQVIIYRLLSLIPFGIIIASTIISNAHDLFYGFESNIYLAFWISNPNLCLTIIVALFIYVTYFIDVYFRHRFSSKDAELFKNGNLYMLILNVTCVLIMVLIALVDMAFKGNEIAYYLGVGNNIWILTLIPFILLCKYGVNLESLEGTKELSLK